MRKLLTLLAVEPGEEVLVGLLWAHSFLMGFSLFVFQTSAEAMFVARYGAQGLPLVYIGWAVAVPLTGLAYARLQRQVPVGTLWTCALGFSLALIVGLAILLRLTDAAWPAFLVNLVTDVLWALVGLEFWGFAGSVLDLRQGKRLFGLIGSGEVASAVIAGAAVGPLLKVVDVYWLFALSALALFACLGILVHLLRRHAAALAAPAQDEEEAQASRGNLGALLKDRYLQLMVALFFLSMLTFDLLEYVYLDQAGARYGNDAEALATFIGTALAIRQAATLLLKAALSGFLLSRFGLSFGLGAQPLWLLLGLLLVLATGMSSGDPGALFWLIVVVVVFDRVVRKAVSKPSEQLLYQPLTRERRLAAHTLMESFVEPVTTGACGVALLGLTLLLAGQSAQVRALSVAAVALGIVAVWLALTRVLRPRYAATLASALARRDLGPAELVLDEPALALLEQRLSSPQPGEAIYALDLLRRAGVAEKLPGHLARLLGHPDTAVRVHALEVAEDLRSPALFAALRERLGREPAEPALGGLLRALCASGEAAALDLVVPYLRHEQPGLRRAATVALVKHGGFEGFLAAAERLSALLRSPGPEDRALAAEVFGEVGARGFSRSLQKLLGDPHLAVRRAALLAAAQVRDPALWAPAAESLAVPTLRAAATRALEAGGEHAVPVLARLFDRPGTPRAALLRIARLCGRLPGPAAVALPLARLAHPDPEVRQALLEALRERGFRAADADRSALEARLPEECRHAGALAGALADLGDDAAAALLRGALEAEIDRCRDLTLLLLSLLNPGPALLDARRHLGSGQAQQRAYAVEVVDNLCPAALRSVVVPLVEARTGSALLSRLQPAPPRLGETGRLRSLCAGDVPWLTPWARACALHLAGRRGLSTLSDVVEARLDDGDPAVRETALWALSRIRPDGAAPQAARRLSDPAPLVAGLARSLLGPLPAGGA